ncbi:MAG: hypothetical protein FWD06_00985 [Oscillospiraceae bacterium]|nr:hypothetical protein [Oscillospiraceae bacterium]
MISKRDMQKVDELYRAAMQNNDEALNQLKRLAENECWYAQLYFATIAALRYTEFVASCSVGLIGMCDRQQDGDFERLWQWLWNGAINTVKEHRQSLQATIDVHNTAYKYNQTESQIFIILAKYQAFARAHSAKRYKTAIFNLVQSFFADADVQNAADAYLDSYYKEKVFVGGNSRLKEILESSYSEQLSRASKDLLECFGNDGFTYAWKALYALLTADKAFSDSEEHKKLLFETLDVFGLHTLINSWADGNDSTLEDSFNNFEKRFGPQYKAQTSSTNQEKSPPHKMKVHCKVCNAYVWVEHGLGTCPLCQMPNDYRYD